MERYDLMGTPYANGERAGILRTANAADEKNSGCTDAAITPSNLHNVLGYRKANTAYTGNEIVACPYHAEFMLKCTQAGTTSTGSLDTTSATLGKVYTDGGVKWEVIVLPVEFGGTGGTTAKDARKNLGISDKFIQVNNLGNMSGKTVADLQNALKDWLNGSVSKFACCCFDANVSWINLWNSQDFVTTLISGNWWTASIIATYSNGNYAKLLLTSYNSNEVLTVVLNNGNFQELNNVGVPVGAIIPTAGGAVSGYLYCNGAAVSRTLYSRLFSAIGTTFGEGDGSTTFNLPDLTDGRFLEGSTSSGIVKEAGLPNISGRITGIDALRNNTDTRLTATGAFAGVTWHTSNTTARGTSQTVNMVGQIGFEASYSNSIYGNAETVQPKSLTIRYYIKY